MKNKTKIVLEDKEQKIAPGPFQPNQGKNNLSKVEGILTSSLQLKEPRNDNPYYYAFFQLEGITQDIPVIFKLDSSISPNQQTPPSIPLRAKVLLEGH